MLQPECGTARTAARSQHCRAIRARFGMRRFLPMGSELSPPVMTTRHEYGTPLTEVCFLLCKAIQGRSGVQLFPPTADASLPPALITLRGYGTVPMAALSPHSRAMRILLTPLSFHPTGKLL